jgi:hypothetical protein
MKWIMLVSGLMTCAGFHAAIAPEDSLRSNFGQTLDGPLAELIVRNWGALIGLVGVALIYGAFHSGARRLALVIAAASKSYFILLMLTLGRPYLHGQVALAVVIDAVMVVVFLAYLVRPAGRAGA